MTATATPGRELLACPFCGGLDLTVYSNVDIGCGVACVDCGLETPTETGTTPDDAIKYWNTRIAAKPADEGVRRNQLDILHRYRTGAYALAETALDAILSLSTTGEPKR